MDYGTPPSASVAPLARRSLGIGLGHALDSHALDSFDVSFAPDEPAQFLRIGNRSGKACGWTLHSFVPGLGLIGAVVVVQHAADEPAATLLTTL